MWRGEQGAHQYRLNAVCAQSWTGTGLAHCCWHGRSIRPVNTATTIHYKEIFFNYDEEVPRTTVKMRPNQSHTQSHDYVRRVPKCVLLRRLLNSRQLLPYLEVFPYSANTDIVSYMLYEKSPCQINKRNVLKHN